MRALAVLLIAQLLALPASAADVGSRDDVRVVRNDTTVLLSDRVRRAGIDPSTIVVDSVVARDGYALAQWHAGAASGVDGLVRIYKRWWNRLQAGSMPPHWAYPPLKSDDVYDIGKEALVRMGFPPALADEAVTNLPLVANGTWKGPPPTVIYPPDDIRFTQSTLHVQSPRTDGFDLHFSWARNDASSDARLVDVTGRRPTDAENWLQYPGGNSYFFFSAVVRSNAAIRVQAGSALDVWFPFVLDPHYRYSLTIAHTDVPIGPIDGSLHDNVLHFELPAFVMSPGVELMGEIEGDPH